MWEKLGGFSRISSPYPEHENGLNHVGCLADRRRCHLPVSNHPLKLSFSRIPRILLSSAALCIFSSSRSFTLAPFYLWMLALPSFSLCLFSFRIWFAVYPSSYYLNRFIFFALFSHVSLRSSFLLPFSTTFLFLSPRLFVSSFSLFLSFS